MIRRLPKPSLLVYSNPRLRKSPRFLPEERLINFLLSF
jgi:hypothetical protein